MADMDMLRMVALKTGLGIKYVSKEEKISAMLSELSQAFPRGSIVLKGGTALNRLHIRKRFSEDIDLDTAEDASVIRKCMERVRGFSVEKPRLMGNVLRYDCYYTSELLEKDRIMVEFNRIKEVKAAEKPRSEVVNSFIFPSGGAALDVYCLEDIVAQKMRALASREDGKDVFDLFYALDLECRRDVLEKAVAIKGFESVSGMKSVLVRRLQEMKGRSRYIGNSANHYIPAGLRPDWKAFMDTLATKIGSL